MVAKIGGRGISTYVGVGLGIGGVLFSLSYLYRQRDYNGALRLYRVAELPVKSLTPVSHDTNRLVLELPEGQTLGGSTGFFVIFKGSFNGKSVIRPYTPVSDPSQTGEAEFVIKKFPNGVMGNYVANLKPGDKVSVRGPISSFTLAQNQFKEIALIGGGSGITPLFQVLQKIAKDPNDKTKVTLYYGSKTPEDVLLKHEIDELISKKPDSLKVVYFVDKNTSKDKSLTEGFINREYLAENLLKPSSEHKVFVCGPDPMYKAICGEKRGPFFQGNLSGVLKELGFTSGDVYKF